MDSRPAPSTAPPTLTRSDPGGAGSLRLTALARIDPKMAAAVALRSASTRLVQATVQQCGVVVYNGYLFYRVRMRAVNGIGVAWVDAGTAQEKALAVYPPVPADQPWPESDYHVAKGLKGSLRVALLARVTPAEADAAALAAVGGGALLRTRLHGTGGFLVYTVTIRTAGRALKSVWVDAGTGEILGTASGFPRAQGPLPS